MKPTVLITGATSGIGKSLVERYLRRSVKVLACGRNPEKLEALQDLDVSPNAELRLVQFDQLDPDAIKASFNDIENVDLAILNAGDCEYIDDAMNFDAQLFKRVIDINLSSVADLVESLLPKLAKAQTLDTDENPQLVLIGSSAAMLPFTRAEAYGASKAGLGYLADTLYIDLHPHNIDVSLVLPGFIETPLTDKNDFEMPFLMSSEEAAKRIIKGIEKRQRHIAFPKRLIWSLKLAGLLPAKWWRNVMLKSQTK